MTAAERTLADVARWLAKRRWMVFGAQAVAVWGTPRQTLDIDVTIDVDHHELQGLIDTAPAHGLVARISDPVGFFTAHFVLPMQHTSTGMTVDVVQLGTAFERLAVSRATARAVLGVEVPVVTAEDLLVYKLGSDRPRDSDDARSVVRRRADQIDADYVRGHLREMERVLDRSDLVSELDRLLAHYRRGD